MTNATKDLLQILEAQKREYTFGTDEFSLEDAYHDCKIVFDGITDEESYQEADTGLILHYANEIIYALRKALEAQEVKTDPISRQGAIDALREEFKRVPTTAIRAKNVIEGLSSAQPEQPEREISYRDCCYAMLKMWIVDVLTDGEYYNIMGKLNEHEKARRRTDEGIKYI